VSESPQINRVARLSLKRNIIFSVVGRGYYALTQFFVILLTARLGTLEDVGVMTLASAIATPLFFLATMGAREVLTVDDLDRFSRADFVLLRLVGGGAAVCMAFAVAVIGYGGESLMIVAAVLGFSLVKFSGAQAAMNHAMFQRAERLDFVAISIFLRCTAGLLAFGLVFWQTRNLPLALICEAAAWMLSYWLMDKRLLLRLGLDTPLASLSQSSLRKIGTLALWVLPIGAALWLVRAALSVPPLVLEHHAGLAAVGLCGALAYVHTALSMLGNALGNASAARLRRCARERRTRDFWSIAQKLVVASLLLGLAATLGAWFFGGMLLTLTFGPAYSQPELFTIIVAASSLSLLASPLTTAIMALQIFFWRVVISGSSLLAALVTAFLLIPTYGVAGAAWSFMASSAAYLAMTLIACTILIRDQAEVTAHG